MLMNGIRLQIFQVVCVGFVLFLVWVFCSSSEKLVREISVNFIINKSLHDQSINIIEMCKVAMR